MHSTLALMPLSCTLLGAPTKKLGLVCHGAPSRLPWPWLAIAADLQGPQHHPQSPCSSSQSLQ